MEMEKTSGKKKKLSSEVFWKETHMHCFIRLYIFLICILHLF